MGFPDASQHRNRWGNDALWRIAIAGADRQSQQCAVSVATADRLNAGRSPLDLLGTFFPCPCDEGTKGIVILQTPWRPPALGRVDHLAQGDLGVMTVLK